MENPGRIQGKIDQLLTAVARRLQTYDHATFQDGGRAHFEFVDTKTRPGKRGKPERGQKRYGMVVAWACGADLRQWKCGGEFRGSRSA